MYSNIESWQFNLGKRFKHTNNQYKLQYQDHKTQRHQNKKPYAEKDYPLTKTYTEWRKLPYPQIVSGWQELSELLYTLKIMFTCNFYPAQRNQWTKRYNSQLHVKMKSSRVNEVQFRSSLHWITTTPKVPSDPRDKVGNVYMV